MIPKKTTPQNRLSPIKTKAPHRVLFLSGLDVFKFGFIGELKIEIVGADVLDGPISTR